MQPSWDDCDVVTQARIIAFDQIRQYDELEEKKALAGFGKGSKPSKFPPRKRRRR